MDGENETVARAAARFKRRRNRNGPGVSLLQALKQSREAAGIPLNAVQEKTQPEEDAESPVNDYIPEDADEHPVSPARPIFARNDGDNLPLNSNSRYISKREKQAKVPLNSNKRYGSCDETQEDSYRNPNQTNVEPEWNGQLSVGESWQADKSVVECNLYMLTYEIGCDVTLVVGEAQEVISAHSYVLTSRSAKFVDLLGDQKLLEHKMVDMPDVKPDTFRHLLRYLYTDEIELTADLASALIPVSSVYGPSSLKTACFSYLLSEMNSDNVCLTFELSHKYNEKDAYTRCLHFVYVNAIDVLRSPNIKYLCRQCVEDIAKSDDLNADEFTVLEAILMWATGECSRKRIQPSEVNRRKVLGKLLFHVRFAMMDVLEFTQQISHRDILSQEEKVVLYQFFHGETHKLPSQFNKSKRHEYKVNHKLVNRAFGKDRTHFNLPNILSPDRSQLIPYKNHQEYETKPPMQRVIRFQGVNKDWQTNGPDAIAFRVSNPIFLYGVQIFGPYNGQSSYKVEITIYDEIKDIVYCEKTMAACNGTEKVHDVLLVSRMYIPPAKTFTVQTAMRGKPGYHGIEGHEVVHADGVSFQFLNSCKSLNGTDVTIGQIPTLLFNKA